MQRLLGSWDRAPAAPVMRAPVYRGTANEFVLDVVDVEVRDSMALARAPAWVVDEAVPLGVS